MKVAVETFGSRFEATALKLELERASIVSEVGQHGDEWRVLVDDGQLTPASKLVAKRNARTTTASGSLRDVDDAALEVVGLAITAATGVPRRRVSGWFWLLLLACAIIAWWLA